MNHSTSICTTGACVKAAEALLSYMAPNHTAIDPCVDWDAYMCDGFRATHVRRPDQSGVSVGNDMSDVVTATLRSILESPYPGESNHSSFSPRNLISVSVSTDEKNFDMMKSYYDSCMNLEKIKAEGAAPLVELLQGIANTFPIDETCYGKNDTMGPHEVGNIKESIWYLNALGIASPFVSVSVGTDDKNPDSNVVWVSLSSQTLPSTEMYKDEDVLRNYTSAMAKVFAAVLPSKSARAAAEHLAVGVVKLETALAALEPPIEDQNDITIVYNPMLLHDTAALAPELGIDYIINNLAPENFTVNRTITPFANLLKNATEIILATPKDVVQAYLLWEAIPFARSILRIDELKPLRQFWNVLNGKGPDDETELYRVCISATSSGLSWIMGRFFIESAFSEQAKELGDQIVLELRQEFASRFNSSTWMDEAVKKEAIAKINKLVQKIGYPDKSPNVTDPESLKQWYSGLEIGNNWLANNLARTKWSNSKQWADLPKPVDKNEWFMAPQVINAYYSPSSNDIVFPAGIMQFPIFDVNLPAYVNYGDFGSIVGHEMSHGFDQSGRHYDQNGVLRDWWTNKTSAEFERRAQCFIEQFENFTLTDSNGKVHHGNGRLALGENIADSGGVAVAYSAWKKRQSHTPDQGLPGLEEFTNDQLFFMFKTPFFCGKYLIEFEIQLMETDPHPPDSYRTVAPLQNSRAWREAFNCPVKEPTCELW